MTCEEIVPSTSISKMLLFRVLINSNLQPCKFVPDDPPGHLTIEQIQKRIHQCFDWKQMLQNDSNFLDTVIMGDETWVHHFVPLTMSIISV